VDEATRAQLELIYAAVDRMSDLDGQDKGMIIEMALKMLGDVTDGPGLAPTLDYVKHYCDVIDSPADAERIAAEISGG
jgi:hypothetical protein